MSNKYITLALDTVTGSTLRKMILVKLADNANDNGLCWPGIKSISTQCECSERAVTKNIEDLIEMGFVSKKDRYTESGRQRSNYYQLHLGYVQNPSNKGEGAPDATPQESNGVEGDNLENTSSVHDSPITSTDAPCSDNFPQNRSVQESNFNNQKIGEVAPDATPLASGAGGRVNVVQGEGERGATPRVHRTTPLEPSVEPLRESLDGEERFASKFQMHGEWKPSISPSIIKNLYSLGMTKYFLNEQMIRYRSKMMVRDDVRTDAEWSSAFTNSVQNIFADMSEVQRLESQKPSKTAFDVENYSIPTVNNKSNVPDADAETLLRQMTIDQRGKYRSFTIRQRDLMQAGYPVVITPDMDFIEIEEKLGDAEYKQTFDKNNKETA